MGGGSLYPIVFVFDAPELTEYAYHALLQARLSNPDAPVFLLSPAKQPHLGVPFFDEGITYVDIGCFRSSAAGLRRKYFHMSVNNYRFERFCIERWFMVRDFARECGLRTLCYLDSDVMLYSDLSEASAPFASYLYATLDGAWTTALVNSIEVLDAFCDLIDEFYSRNTPLWPQALEMLGLFTPYDAGTSCGVDNISDMFLGSIFEKLRPNLPVGSLLTIHNNSVFDLNINVSEPQFEGDAHGRKRIEFREGVPYGRLAGSSQEIRFHTLHFQGPAKKELIEAFKTQARPWFARCGFDFTPPQ